MEMISKKYLMPVKRSKFLRNNRKPFFLLFNNYRWREHCGPNYDNNIGYRTEKEFKSWKKRDPLLNSYNLLKKFKINKITINDRKNKH